MKKIIIAALLVVASQAHSLLSVCSNNNKDCHHVKKYGLNRSYSCKCKTKEFYGDDANRYYEGNSCSTCGCESEEHTDE